MIEDYYIILLSGKAGSGKNSVADFIKELLPNSKFLVTQESYASPLKDLCKQHFSLLSTVLKKELNYEIKNEHWYESKTNITRSILQIVGTSLIRKFNEDFFVDELIKRVAKVMFFENKKINVFTVSDTRFPNELFLENKLDKEIMFESYKIIKVRIEKGKDVVNLETEEHSSETQLDEYAGWDYIITNDGKLEDLKIKTQEMLNEIFFKSKNKGEKGMKTDNNFYLGSEWTTFTPKESLTFPATFYWPNVTVTTTSNYVDHNFDSKYFEDRVEYYFSLPGLSKEDIEIEILDKNLHINASKKGLKGNDFYYNKTLYMAENFDLNTVEAGCINGLLTVKILFKKPVIKKIEVK